MSEKAIDWEWQVNALHYGGPVGLACAQLYEWADLVVREKLRSHLPPEKFVETYVDV